MATAATLPPDRYGSRILPQISCILKLEGVRHPIEISGRHLRCRVHQNDATSGMIVSTKTAPPCVGLSRDWHNYFALRPGSERNALVRRPEKVLRQYQEEVTRAMIDEIVTNGNLSNVQAQTALVEVPQMQIDPCPDY